MFRSLFRSSSGSW